MINLFLSVLHGSQFFCILELLHCVIVRSFPSQLFIPEEQVILLRMDVDSVGPGYGSRVLSSLLLPPYLCRTLYLVPVVLDKIRCEVCWCVVAAQFYSFLLTVFEQLLFLPSQSFQCSESSHRYPDPPLGSL